VKRVFDAFHGSQVQPNLATQFGLWLTPIFWNMSLIPAEYAWAVKVNPAYYLKEFFFDTPRGL